MDNQQKASVLLVTGLVLIGINFLALAPFVAGQVEAGVADAVADGYDGYDDDGNKNYTNDYDDEWLVSTSERVYFAYSLDNPEGVDAGEAHEFTKMGPFIYEVTTTREILDFDYDAGEITYSEFDSFEWCENCTWIDDNGDSHNSVSGSTEITQVNILWNTQRIAGISTGIIYGEVFAKAGFANSMIANDLQNRAPSIWASEDISGLVAANGAVGTLAGAYMQANGGSSDGMPDFSTYTDGIMTDAVDPSTGTCIALTCDIGPMLVAGMGAPDGGATTQTRAALYGYADSGEQMNAIDLAVYSLAGGTFLARGGGAELSEATDLRERLDEVSGVDIADPDVLNGVLFGTPDADIANGLLSVSDYSGIPLNGVALFLLGADGDLFGTMTTYGIGLTQLLGLSDYAGQWIGLVGTPTEFEMILAGGQGTINADDWWQLSFGGEEPIAGGYIPIGLNRGDFEGAVNMDVAKVQEILYTSPYALTSDFARVFMYGELSGSTLPTEEGGETTDWNDAYVAGLYDISESDASAVRSWVADFMFDQVIGALLGFQYGASAYTTQPIDHWLFGWRDIIVADLVDGDINNPDFGWQSLETNKTYFGSNNVTTGDYDVYVASTEGDDMGQRLRQGYINSDEDGLCDFKLNSDGTMADADSSGMYPCEDGELYGFTEHLPWRAPHRETSTLGLLSAHVGNNNTVVAGAVGGVADSENSFKVNLVGYAMAESVPGNMETYKGIEMRAHTVNLDPSQNQIQAKLIGSASFVDVLPGALPVYFSSTVDIKVEPVTQVAMYGKSISMFHLDLRGPGMLNPEMDVDTHPVFEIHTFSEIGDEDAETFKCRVLDNMEPMYWTDFGGEGDCALEGTSTIDIVTAALYVASVGMIAAGGWMMMGASGAGGSLVASSEEED